MLTVALRGGQASLTLLEVHDEDVDRHVVHQRVAQLAALGCSITTAFVRRPGFSTTAATSPDIDAARDVLTEHLAAASITATAAASDGHDEGAVVTFDRLSVLDGGYATDFALGEPGPDPEPPDGDEVVVDHDTAAALAAAAMVLPDLRAWTGDGRNAHDHARAQESADLIVDGNVVRVQPSAAPALLEDLGSRPAPSDLTRVHIVGYPNLFASVARNNVPREDMPQLPVGHLDEFKAFLHRLGIRVTAGTADPAALSATQNQLDGRKAGAMLHNMRTGSMDGTEHPIWISADNKVLDGHHRWAAEAVLSTEAPRQIAVMRASAPMTQLLGQARRFNEQQGIESKSHGQMALERTELAGTSEGARKAWITRRSHAAATDVVRRVKYQAPAITADIIHATVANGGKTSGLRFRFKGRDSLVRKIRDKALTKGVSVAESAASITDALRFTSVVPTERYTEAVTSMIDTLHQRGYDVSDIDNHWHRGDAYNGLNMLIRHGPTGVIAELQVHTPESLAAKAKIHAAYEEYRLLTTPERTRKVLFQSMVETSDQAPIPPAVMDIGNTVIRPHAPHAIRPVA